MSTEGRAAENSGDDAVSSAPIRESDKQRAAGPSRDPHHTQFTGYSNRKTSKLWLDGREYWVYAHLAADGAVLYIGCTVDRKSRESSHRSSSAWYPLVAKTIYKGPYSRAEGLWRERRLIEKYDPPNNYQHTTRYVHKRSLKVS